MNTVTIPVLSRFVWFDGRCWFNPSRPLDHMGRVELWSLSESSAGIDVDADKVRPCDAATIAAIREAQDAGQLLKF